MAEAGGLTGNQSEGRGRRKHVRGKDTITPGGKLTGRALEGLQDDGRGNRRWEGVAGDSSTNLSDTE